VYAAELVQTYTRIFLNCTLDVQEFLGFINPPPLHKDSAGTKEIFPKTIKAKSLVEILIKVIF